MLGLVALPLTGVAGIAVILGEAVKMVIALLLIPELTVGAAAFAVINRRGALASADHAS